MFQEAPPGQIPKGATSKEIYETVGSTILNTINTHAESKKVLRAITKNVTTLINPERLMESQKLKYKGEDVQTLCTLVQNLEKVSKYIRKNL